MDSGASHHMMSGSYLTPEEQETIQKSKDPTVIMTARGTSQTTEQATVYVCVPSLKVQNRQPHSLGCPRRASNRTPD